MRKLLWLAVLAMLCCGAAHAEEPGWAFEDEMIYHKMAYCGGEFNRDAESKMMFGVFCGRTGRL